MVSVAAANEWNYNSDIGCFPFEDTSMTTATSPSARELSRTASAAQTLHNGDRLPQAEFHRRYLQYPEDVCIELLGGIVYMASPTCLQHGCYQAELSALFVLYKAGTPGVEATGDATVILNEANETQPDVLLRVLPEYGGRSHTTEQDFVEGSPELIAEIAYSRVAIDLHVKVNQYQQAGVLEYIVVSLEEAELRWFDLQANAIINPTGDGILRSHAFPGLWLDPGALIDRNTSRSVKVLGHALKSEEHAEFVRRLERRKSP